MSYPHDPYAQKYIDERSGDRREEFLARAEKKVKEARNAFYIIAALSAIGGIILFIVDKTNGVDVLITNLVLSFIYLLLASYLEKKPRLIVIIGLVLFCAIWLINIIIEPEYIVRGFIIKIFIIYSLVKGYKAAIEIENLRRQLGKMDNEENAPLDMIN